MTILAWVGVATAKGDYRYRPPNFLFGAQQKAMLLACFSGALTWVGNINYNLHLISALGNCFDLPSCMYTEVLLQYHGALAARRSVEAHGPLLSFVCEALT